MFYKSCLFFRTFSIKIVLEIALPILDEFTILAKNNKLLHEINFQDIMEIKIVYSFIGEKSSKSYLLMKIVRHRNLYRNNSMNISQIFNTLLFFSMRLSFNTLNAVQKGD